MTQYQHIASHYLPLKNITLIKELENITDDSLFEKVCISILRKSNDKYSTLNNTGSNEKGRTVRDPLDGITIITDAYGTFKEAIALECTTIRSNLKSKLLEKENPKKGDIIKSIEKLKKIRKTQNEMSLTIVLCTNRRIPSELIIKLKTVCRNEKINIDIWDFNRLNDFLLLNPAGQYINHLYFNFQIELISQELLKKIISSNIQQYKNEFDYLLSSITRNNQIDFEAHVINTKGLIILKGESGNGKTTTCIQLMESLYNQNYFVLRISKDIIEKSNSLESALNTVLKASIPSLINKPEEFVFQNNPILIIDDINRSNSPQKLLNKIELWIKRSIVESRLNFTLVCPLWSRNVSFTPIHYEKKYYLSEFIIHPFNENECNQFTKVHPDFDYGIDLFKMLEYNPFLIGKVYNNRLVSRYPNDIIEEYIKKEIGLVAEENKKFIVDYLTILKKFTIFQLIEKDLYPSEEKIYNYFSPDKNFLISLNEIISKGTILYSSKSFDSVNTIKFRHDKIHEFFIKKAIKINLNTKEFQEPIIFNPYFSEYVGSCLQDLSLSKLDEILEKQPLIAFFYLKNLEEPKTEQDFKIIKKIVSWFKTYVSEENIECSKFQYIINVIYDIDSSVALELSNCLKHSRHKVNIGFQNGEPVHAINFFASRIDHEPSVGDNYRDRIIKIHKENYINSGVDFIKKILKSDNHKLIFKKSALIYAGYLATPLLSQTILKYFEVEENKKEILAETIWAIMNCCKYDLKEPLKSTFHLWASLPNDDKEFISSRGEVAERLRFAIGRIKNKFLDKALIYYFDTNDNLKNYIYAFLKQIDSPLALEKYLVVLSDLHQKHLDSEGNFPAHLMGSDLLFKNNEVKQRGNETQKKLKELWENNKGCHLGKFAFEFWIEAIGKNELNLLQSIEKDSPYFVQALERRLTLNDRSSIDSIFPLLKKHKFRNSHKIWNDDLFKKIKSELIENPNIPVSNYLLSIPENQASILLKLYNQNSSNTRYLFQYGLYIGTNQSLTYSKEIFEMTEDKSGIFQYISQTFSNFDANRKKNLSINKLNNLNRYIPYMEKEQLHNLVFMCIQENMLLWGKQNIGNKVTKNDGSFMPTSIEGMKKYFFLTINELVENYFSECKCSCNKYCRLDSWIENISKNGYSISEFKIAIKSHVESNLTISTYEDICAFLKLEGKIDDLDWIEEMAKNIDETKCKKILEDTKFEINKVNF